MIKKLLLGFAGFLLLAFPAGSFAQESIPLTTPETQFEAEVVEVVSEEKIAILGTEQIVQVLKLRKDDNTEFTAENGGLATASTNLYEEGDRVVVSQITQPDGTEQFFIIGYVRRDALLGLFVLFVIVTIAVAGRKGVASILGMAYSFFIIFSFVLPQISSGQNPIIIAIFGGMLIIPITFYISHGFNPKTHAAIIGTIISLIITAILSHFAIEWAHLTGFASEDANFLEVMSKGSINIKGLLLAGIIVGLFGILDDITVSQAAIVYKLKETSPGLPAIELYRKAMDVGRDHIGSLINTLILVYTGAALPFLLLITSNSEMLLTTINFEIIAEEIVRTLTASIGLVLAVPITTFIAVFWKGLK